MRNEIGFAALGGQEGESEETLEYFDQVGCKFIALDQDLEKIVLDYVRFSKRPLLVFILGTSVLNQNHLSQVTEVLKDQNFDSLDLLLQIVAGDGKVGYDIVNMIRSKVTGTITSIVPCVLSGPGSLIALGTDQVIGTVTSSIAPPNFVTLHPAIRVWHIGKGKVHPAYYENQAEYNQLHPQNYEYANGDFKTFGQSFQLRFGHFLIVQNPKSNLVKSVRTTNQ